MKIEKLVEAQTTGAYYVLINHNREEDTREFEVVQGPVSEVIDYAAEQAATFLVDYLGADASFLVYLISPRIATALSGSDQQLINKVVEEIMEYREEIVNIDGCNASDWVVDYINTIESDPYAIMDDPNFDIVEVSATPEFKACAVDNLKKSIAKDFKKFSE